MAEPAYGGTIVNFDAAYGGDDAASDGRDDSAEAASTGGPDATCHMVVPLYGGPYVPPCFESGDGGGD
jgi:hypothetical protein